MFEVWRKSSRVFYRFETLCQAEKRVSMACLKSKAVVLGHSFIHPLEDDIKSAHKPWLLRNFGLEQCDAYFVHEGGWKVSVKHETFLREVQATTGTTASPI